LDLRERVIGHVSGGASTHAAAARFEIGVATVGRWMRRYRATGSMRPGRQGKPRGSKLDAHEDFLLGLVSDEPDLTLEEVRARLLATHGMTAATGTVWLFYDRRGITFKKKPVRR
jgi:transposase